MVGKRENPTQWSFKQNKKKDSVNFKMHDPQSKQPLKKSFPPLLLACIILRVVLSSFWLRGG
jgi:hypothetical protein